MSKKIHNIASSETNGVNGIRFSTRFLDDLRERVPISSVIHKWVMFNRKKSNSKRGYFWAKCPFHRENSPSFHCEDRGRSAGRYHCFGCGVSGDHFRFLVEIGGMTFPEAVRHVAEMANVEMPEEYRDKACKSSFESEISSKKISDEIRLNINNTIRRMNQRGVFSATDKADSFEKDGGNGAIKNNVVLGNKKTTSNSTSNITYPSKKMKNDFYFSWEWRTLRKEVLNQYGARCQCCGTTPAHVDMGGKPVRIVVDHIKPLAKHWELRLDRANLQILCDECNQGAGAWDETDHRPTAETPTLVR